MPSAQPGCGSNPLACPPGKHPASWSSSPVGPWAGDTDSEEPRSRTVSLPRDDGRKRQLRSTSGCKNLPNSHRRGQEQSSQHMPDLPFKESSAFRKKNVLSPLLGDQGPAGSHPTTLSTWLPLGSLRIVASAWRCSRSPTGSQAAPFQTLAHMLGHESPNILLSRRQVVTSRTLQPCHLLTHTPDCLLVHGRPLASHF